MLVKHPLDEIADTAADCLGRVDRHDRPTGGRAPPVEPGERVGGEQEEPRREHERKGERGHAQVLSALAVPSIATTDTAPPSTT